MKFLLDLLGDMIVGIAVFFLLLFILYKIL